MIDMTGVPEDLQYDTYAAEAVRRMYATENDRDAAFARWYDMKAIIPSLPAAYGQWLAMEQMMSILDICTGRTSSKEVSFGH